MTKQRLDMTRRLFASLDVYHDPDRSRSAAMNMAIDEALLDRAEAPAIRFYQWDHPALSFGYGGKFGQAAGFASERDLVRRWTGGGIVFHGEDLTYSIIVPASDSVFSESSVSTYENVHRALCQALARIGQRAELVIAAANGPFTECAPGPSEPSKNKDLCFANPVQSDVIVNGRKVGGAAQRRTRHGLLQQGSVQIIDPGNELPDLFAYELGQNLTWSQLDEKLVTRAAEIAHQKYGTNGWLKLR